MGVASLDKCVRHYPIVPQGGRAGFAGSGR